jgi:hypothetical protein
MLGAVMRKTWYFCGSSPMMIFRVPYPMPRWRDILKAITPVMQAHGRRRKDFQPCDLLRLPDQGWDKNDDHFAGRLDLAFSRGSEILPAFHLYDWRGGNFLLVREALMGG